jgi:type IV fimbrial biogenesis protein FimT
MKPVTVTRQYGTSFVELLAVLAIAAIALSASLPYFGGLRASMLLRSNVNEWMTTLSQARTTAVMQARNVVACPAAAGHCVDSVYWHHDWILFEDINRDGERGPAERLLLAGRGSDEVRIAGSTGRQRIRYLPDGSSEGSNLTLTFCDRRGPAQARSIVLNNAGRARTGKPTPAQAARACG